MLGDTSLKVVTEERYRRTVVTAIPDEIRNIKDETWIPECIRIFSTDWTVVQNHEEDRGRCGIPSINLKPLLWPPYIYLCSEIR